MITIIISAFAGSLFTTIMIRLAEAANARRMKRIHEIAVEVFRRGALREARKALAEVARCPHDKEHVKRVANKGIADSTMPVHLAEEGER